MTATWLSKMELATYLGITTRTVDRWRKGADFYKFPTPRYIAGRPRWHIKDIDNWMSKQPTKLR